MATETTTNNDTNNETGETVRKRLKIPRKAENRRFTIVEPNGKSHEKCAIADLFRENGRLCVRFAAWNGTVIPKVFFGDEVAQLFVDSIKDRKKIEVFTGISWKQKRRKVRSDRVITEDILSGFLFGES